MILHLKTLNNMEVIVKSSPKIEIELATKVVKAGGGDVKADGVYPDLTAGDLAGRGESVPAEFGFRASGGKSIKDGRAYIKRIKGNSVVWNQYNEKGAWVAQGGTASHENGIYTIVPDGTNAYVGIRQPNVYGKAGHKYLLIFEAYVEGASDIGYNIFGASTAIQKTEGTWNVLTIFVTAPYDNNANKILFSKNPTLVKFKDSSILVDLTKAFPNDWQNINTIEDFYARVATLGVDMNAYNEGQVIHCNTESIKSVGDNAWDEEWESGNIDANGQNEVNATRIRSKNYIDVLPNAEYCFTIPKGMTSNDMSSNDMSFFFYDSEKKFIGATGWIGYQTKKITTLPNARYARFRLANFTTYNHDIMIRLDHSGWKTEVLPDYQPYWQDTLPLPIISKYFPQGMKSAGTAHDEIRYNKESGKWEAVEAIGTRAYQEGDADNAAYLTDGKVTCYPLAGSIVTELDAEDQNFRGYYQVADFGTEMSQSSVPSAPFSADIIYQFNAVDMIREHEIEITELQNVIAIMQAQLTSLINGGQ